MGIKVIIYENNNSLRDSLALLLEESLAVSLAGTYSDCLDVTVNLRETRQDAVIMDIDLPAFNSLEGVKVLRHFFLTVYKLLRTVVDVDEKVFDAFKTGTGEYILKNSEPKNQLNTISEEHNGVNALTPGISKSVLDQIYDLLPKEKIDYHLSRREREVLNLLVEGNSYKMIAGKMNITYDTVRAHMKKIYEKLHVASMTEAVAKAINQQLFSGL